MRVVIVVPPFGPVEYPVLGASLLKAILRDRGIDCRLDYALLDFADRLGFSSYNATYCSDPPLLAGDRIFARALFGNAVRSAEDYWGDVVLPFTDRMLTKINLEPFYQERFRDLKHAEREAIAFAEEAPERPSIRESDVVGFSSTFGQHVAALAMARRVKECFPEKTIVFGGANCEGVMGRQTLESFPFIDFVSTGPADLSLPALLAALESGETPQIPGMLGRGMPASSAGPAPVDLDALPLPDFDDFFEAYERFPEDRWRIYSIPVEGARGCWWGQKHHCVFCGINGEQMGFRRKSAGRFYQEINALVERYGVRRIWATDNILDMSYFRELIPLLSEKHSYEEMFFEVKANLQRHQLRALAAAGITRLQPGIESLDTGVLKLMKKGTTALQNLEFLKWAEEFGIALQWNILCGFAGEDPEVYRRMAALMQRIPHLHPPKACSQITIDRFSPLFDRAESFGIQVEPARAYRYVYPLDTDVVARLAYFHSQRSAQHDTRQSLRPPDYATCVANQAKIWQALYGRVEFSYAVLPGGEVDVADTRPGAHVVRTRLRDLERDVFLRAEQAVSIEHLCAELASEGRRDRARAEIDAVVARLRRAGYLHHEDGRVLTLANPRPADGVVREGPAQVS